MTFLFSCSVSNYTLKQNTLLPYKEFAEVTKIVEELKPIKINSIKDKRDRVSIGKAYTGVKYNETPISLSIPVKQYVYDYLLSAFEMRNLPIDAE